MMSAAFTAMIRTRKLGGDADGAHTWHVVETRTDLVPERTAAVLCDVWDRHWCPTARRRLDTMVPTMNRVVAALRGRGAVIVHAPSETIGHYAGHPARNRVLDHIRELPAPEAPAPIDVPELPVHVGATDGCDASLAARPRQVWTRQHPGISIDERQDLISDDGAELARVFRRRDITTVLILGVHTNMCILHRSFGVKALLGYGFQPLLVRDLTDAMYDPADPPYVSHADGTGLVVEYIEKFLCGTITSAALLQ